MVTACAARDAPAPTVTNSYGRQLGKALSSLKISEKGELKSSKIDIFKLTA
jgi:hypothetical protein